MGPTNKMGRPTKYDPKYHPKKARYFGFLGWNNREMIAFFEIGEPTFYEWIDKHEEFRKAIEKGRVDDVADLTKSLQKRSNGYTYKEVKRTISPARKEWQFLPDPENPDQLKQVEVHIPECVVETVETVKTLPPDVGALRFALTNRDGARWREAAHIDHTSNGKDMGAKEMDLSLLTDEQIKTLAELEAIAKGLKPNT